MLIHDKIYFICFLLLNNVFVKENNILKENFYSEECILLSIHCLFLSQLIISNGFVFTVIILKLAENEKINYFFLFVF